MERTYGLHEIDEVAGDFLRLIDPRKVIAFHGELGAGKTTFIRAVCRIRHVVSAVSSPTFSIINEYGSHDEKIFHIDLYRLKDEQEAVQAGVEECLYSGSLCMVEWPERAVALFPDNTVHVYLEFLDQFARRIVIREN